MIRRSLRRRLVFGIVGYVFLLTLAVLAHGLIINESAERLVWKALLDNELDHARQRLRTDSDFETTDTERMFLYRLDHPEAIPVQLRGLDEGLHDEVRVGEREHVVLVDRAGDLPVILALDITELENEEMSLSIALVSSAIGMLLLLGLLVTWSVDRLVRPLSVLAYRIGNLKPDHSGERLEIDGAASHELTVISQAVNDYLSRNDQFVERERRFINSASHELRTPIAVIDGASSIALSERELPASVRNQLARIQRTSKGLERLIALLLVLAKDPKKLVGARDVIALNELIPEIVEDHQYLASDKELVLSVATLEPCQILAPYQIVQSAIGNLLRNAIENSDRGEIVVSLSADATVSIQDPGHGMSPEEISVIYAKLSRGGGSRGGGGIGIDLISRVCEHLGWHLDFSSEKGRGTLTKLQLSNLLKSPNSD